MIHMIDDDRYMSVECVQLAMRRILLEKHSGKVKCKGSKKTLKPDD